MTRPSVSTALRATMATDDEAEAAKLKDEPAAVALYLACAGKMALLVEPSPSSNRQRRVFLHHDAERKDRHR